MRDVEFELTKADYRELYFVSSWRRVWRMPLTLGALLSALNVARDYSAYGLLPLSRWVADAILGFGIAFGSAAAILLLNTWSGGKVHGYVSHLARSSKMRWDDRSIHTVSAYATASYPWQIARKWMETSNLLVIYLAIVYPLVIPKRALEGEELCDIRRRLKDAGIEESPRRLF